MYTIVVSNTRGVCSGTYAIIGFTHMNKPPAMVYDEEEQCDGCDEEERKRSVEVFRISKKNGLVQISRVETGSILPPEFKEATSVRSEDEWNDQLSVPSILDDTSALLRAYSGDNEELLPSMPMDDRPMDDPPMDGSPTESEIEDYKQGLLKAEEDYEQGFLEAHDGDYSGNPDDREDLVARDYM